MSEIRGCSKCKSSKLLSYFAINVKGQYFKTCNKCRGKTGKKKLTIEECQEFAKTKGGICLSEVYTYNHIKMQWKCQNNHIWNANFNNIKTGTWCPECAGKKKLTIEECQEFAKTKGGICLSEVYVNSDHKMSWKCQNNHTWNAKFDSIKSGWSWCPVCAGKKKLTIEECQEFEKMSI